jgi:hypothetical protein
MLLLFYKDKFLILIPIFLRFSGKFWIDAYVNKLLPYLDYLYPFTLSQLTLLILFINNSFLNHQFNYSLYYYLPIVILIKEPFPLNTFEI